jgi:flavodoxin
MHSVLILWAPDSAENRRVIEAVTGAFNAAMLAPLAKKVIEASITDITASEIVVLGTQKTNSSDIPPDYSEFLRVFKGVTLAGRTAGLFSMGSEKSTGRLRKALKDTEISTLEEDPLFADPKSAAPTEIAAWVKKLVAFHQEFKNAHA